MHRGRIPGFSNWRARMPGGPELEGQNTSGKSEVRARLPRPHFCNTGPDYLVGSRLPGRGQKWARLPGRGRGQLGRGGGERGEGKTETEFLLVRSRPLVMPWCVEARVTSAFFFASHTSAASHPGVSAPQTRALLARGVHHTAHAHTRFALLIHDFHGRDGRSQMGD